MAPTPKPVHTITNQNLVVNMGGSAQGHTATWKKRMGGRNVQTVTRTVSTGNAQLLKTHAIWHDENGVEHIHYQNQLRKVSDLNLNIVRREPAKRG